MYICIARYAKKKIDEKIFRVDAGKVLYDVQEPVRHSLYLSEVIKSV
jgi:hypothetical protein